MGQFLQAILFPGQRESFCREAFARCAEDPELSIQLSACFWHIYKKGPAVLLNDGSCAFEAPSELSVSLGSPVMLLYIYDGDFWGYDLWESGVPIDQFASLPDYFGEGSPPNLPGNAQMVSECFGVAPERVSAYLVPWDMTAAPGGFAYEGDCAERGDSWQIADFMDALGFSFDQLCPPDAEDSPPAKSGNFQQTVPNNTPFPEVPRRMRTPDDTPELPNALTDYAYALRRAKALGEACAEIVRLLPYGLYQDAVNLLTEAIRLTPDEPAFYLIRAFCWNQMEGSVNGRSRRPEMDRDLSKALELESDNVWALRGRCPTAATTARYKRHVADLTRLIELDAENQDLYLLSRAYRYHWLGDDASARLDLETVVLHDKLWTVDLVYLCQELGFPIL